MPQEYINENISAPMNISLGKKPGMELSRPLKDVSGDMQQELQANQTSIQELQASLQ